MSDLVTTGIFAATAAHILRESVTAMTLPSSKTIGLELDEYTKSAMRRIRRIASSGQRKLGGRPAGGGEAVNPRVFRKIIDEGYLSGDGLSADYYGGFLASSYSKEGKDDTNVPFIAMINQMSSDQLHGHWILYSILFNQMRGRKNLNVYVAKHRKDAALYIPWRTFMFLFEALRIDDVEDPEPKFEFAGSGREHSVTVNVEFVHGPIELESRRLDLVFWGLLNNGLVEHLYWGQTGWDLGAGMEKDFPSDPLGIAPKEFSRKEAEEIVKSKGLWSDSTSVEKGGVVFVPSILGMDLFLRAHGLQPDELIDFGCLNYEFHPEEFKNRLVEGVRFVGLSS